MGRIQRALGREYARSSGQEYSLDESRSSGGIGNYTPTKANPIQFSTTRAGVNPDWTGGQRPALSFAEQFPNTTKAWNESKGAVKKLGNQLLGLANEKRQIQERVDIATGQVTDPSTLSPSGRATWTIQQHRQAQQAAADAQRAAQRSANQTARQQAAADARQQATDLQNTRAAQSWVIQSGQGQIDTSTWTPAMRMQWMKKMQKAGVNPFNPTASTGNQPSQGPSVTPPSGSLAATTGTPQTLPPAQVAGTQAQAGAQVPSGPSTSTKKGGKKAASPASPGTSSPAKKGAAKKAAAPAATPTEEATTKTGGRPTMKPAAATPAAPAPPKAAKRPPEKMPAKKQSTTKKAAPKKEKP